ncbi:MAG: acetyltransferase [Thermomicrobiales bacterium]|nr:acetyltransferase [Thermomicrobiales bacterium]
MPEPSSVIEREAHVSFRPLERADFGPMIAWLGDADVSPWWETPDRSPQGIEDEYGDMIDGTDPVLGFIIEIDATPVGYIQCYRLGDHPDYLKQVELDPDDVSTDLFIGHPDYRNRGWGAPVLSAFLRTVVFGELRAQRASIMPFPHNARAIKVYERVGFKPVRVVPVFDPDTGKTEDELIMLLSRDNFFADQHCP